MTDMHKKKQYKQNKKYAYAHTAG